MDQPADDAAWPSPGYAWYVVLMLMTAYAVSILDRVVLGLLVDPIQSELGLSNTQVGLLQGVAFGICFSLMGYPLGLLVDRFQRRRIVAAGILTWSAATAAGGLTRGFPELFASRMFVGVGEASLAPAASSLIADCFPLRRRARAYGVYVTGTAVGTGLAFLFGAAALVWADEIRVAYPDMFGGISSWRIVFFLSALPGLVLGILALLTLREPPRRERASAIVSARALRAFLSANGLALGTLTLGVSIKLMASYAMLAWFPTLFVRQHGWTMADVGQAIGLIAAPFGVIGALSSGWLIGWIERSGREDAPVLLAMIAGVGYSLAVIIACIAPTPYIAVGGYAALALFANWPTAAAYVGLNRITPNELRGRVTALYGLTVGLVSLGVGPLSVGLLMDYALGPQGLQTALCIVAGASLVAGVLVLNAGRGAFIRSCELARSWTGI